MQHNPNYETLKQYERCIDGYSKTWTVQEIASWLLSDVRRYQEICRDLEARVYELEREVRSRR